MDVFDKLAETDVPPPPEAFDRQVHQRLNHMLVVLHVADLVLRGIPSSAIPFARTLWAFVKFTLTGRYGDRPHRRWEN